MVLMMTWIQTYSGKKFSLSDPQPEDVCMEDIAHSLALTARFGGHTRAFYSVAQHSVLASKYIDQQWSYDALMHDAPEAYYGDLCTPFKLALAEVTGDSVFDLLHRIDTVVADAMGYWYPLATDVTLIDQTLLATEKRDLLGNGPDWGLDLPKPMRRVIAPWTCTKAEKLFSEQAERLCAEMET